MFIGCNVIPIIAAMHDLKREARTVTRINNNNNKY
jgi:hypothetical protein